MPEKLESLCFFLATGQTFTFRNVEIVYDNQTAIQFTYKAMSDTKTKVGTFYKDQIAGVAKDVSAPF